ncbi:putative sterigmatocystin biosynthesis P450 monooxygenase stcS [Naviculisporaceae sp. PSN 640]
MLARILLVAIPLAAIYIYNRLRAYRFKKYAHLPQIKPSLIWGHLQVLHQYMKGRPHPDKSADDVFQTMSDQLSNPPVFMVDLWPVGYPMAIITTHHVAEQISRSTKVHPYSVPKSPTMGAFNYLIGPKSLITENGHSWKTFRKRFNPGFAPQHIVSLLPCIIDKTFDFLKHLDSFAATGESFELLHLTINLTFDIIGAVVMDEDFEAQTEERRGQAQGEFIRLYVDLIHTYDEETRGLPSYMAPRKLLTRRRLGLKIDAILKGLIRHKFEERKRLERKGEKGGLSSRSVLSLALQDVNELSDELLSVTVDQVKSFLFAGHDTTSILLTWVIYELSRTPRAAKAVHDELDDIFGSDPDPRVVRDKLLSGDGEELLSKMSYTSAVLKEVLRLHPPAGSARYTPEGSGFSVTDDRGNVIPLDGTVMYLCHDIIQRDRAVYGDTAHDFVPERWLGNSDTTEKGTNVDDHQTNGHTGKDGGAKAIPPGAWRPFERGPRNCIGQELANIEARVIIAMIARRYEFTKVGLGELELDEKGQGIMDERLGQYKVKDEMYSVRQVTSKPADAMRVKVKLAERAGPLK